MRNELETVFGDCHFSHNCGCIFKSSFISIRKKNFYIYDEGGISNNPIEIHDTAGDCQLAVKNPLQKDVLVVKVDKCLLPEDTQKCDCIISTTNEAYLVEIKSCSPGKRGARRKKAQEQLEATINYLRDRNVQLAGYEVTALICFKSIEPRITKASINTMNAIFKEKFNISLKEGNVIEI
jgi:hypothetical protein